MNQSSPAPPTSPAGKSLWRLFLFGMSTYLAIVVMLAFLQRTLIYLPSRASRIDSQDAGLPLGRVHTLTLRTDDDLELRGWHLLPNGQSAADPAECDEQLALGRPVVLYFSGNAGHRAWRIEEFELLTQLGCDVFVLTTYAVSAFGPGRTAVTALPPPPEPMLPKIKPSAISGELTTRSASKPGVDQFSRPVKGSKLKTPSLVLVQINSDRPPAA